MPKQSLVAVLVFMIAGILTGCGTTHPVPESDSSTDRSSVVATNDGAPAHRGSDNQVSSQPMNSSPITVGYHEHSYSVMLKLVPPNDIGKEIYELQKADEIIIGDGGTFPVGTELFEIKGVPVNRYIAVEINTNTYLEAELQGWFPVPLNSTS